MEKHWVLTLLCQIVAHLGRGANRNAQQFETAGSRSDSMLQLPPRTAIGGADPLSVNVGEVERHCAGRLK